MLIDEYDVPLDKAYHNGYYDRMLGTIRALLSKMLKSNQNLYFAVLTGCLRIARESIFTGLNNFKVMSISDTEFAGYFGFTDQEVREMLAYFDCMECYDDIKEWYDGYHFGKTEVYCPWDIINHLDKLRTDRKAAPASYWVNSSSNSIIQDILREATQTTKNELELLISGEVIEKKLMPEFTYKDLDSEDVTMRETYLWSVLFATGYLTEIGRTERGFSRLVIPNREVHEIFEDKIMSWYRTNIRRDTGRWKEMCDAIEKGDAKQFENLFDQCMRESISIRDSFSRKDMKENFYHGMLLGILQCNDDWIVKSNQESGLGYSDIIIRIPNKQIGCIIEVKYAENASYDAACAKAMQQIQSMNYTDVFEQEVLCAVHTYGVACYKKKCKISYVGR